MAKVKIQGHASGTGVLTVTAPNTSTDRTITLPDSTGTLATTADTGVAGITSAADATAITIDSSENVGIGQTSPSSANSVNTFLHIGNSSTAQSSIILEDDEQKWEIAHNGDIAFRKDTTAHFRVGTSLTQVVSTDFQIGGGDLIFGTAGKGVVLGNTSNVDANTLDDYEEGTWTPTISGTNSCSMSTIHQSDYTKVGNVVKLYTSFNVASSATPATGTLIFGGFPFSFKTSGETAFLISLHYNYKDTPMAFVNQNGNIYYQNGTTGGNNLGNLTEAFDAVTVVGMNFTYLTS